MNATRCSIEGCQRKTLARGWCELHYSRWRKHNDPLMTLTPNLVVGSPEERFWAKVDAFGDCWEWTAYKNKDGYGIFRPGNKRTMIRAHRFSWMILVGNIPPDKELDHLCRNRGCVNPDHLEPVTHRVNMSRTDLPTKALQRLTAQRTHCPKNHPYSGENLLMDNGARRCRTCKNNGQNARYQQRKEARNSAR